NDTHGLNYIESNDGDDTFTINDLHGENHIESNDGEDSFVIYNTHGVNYITSNADIDTFTIHNTNGENYIESNEANDIFTIFDTNGLNIIEANEGTDIFNIFDTHGVNEIYGGHSDGVETAATGSDTFNVMGISGTVDMMGNEGDDLFIFGDRDTATFANTNGSFRIFGNAGDDDFDLLINNTAGPVSDLDAIFYTNEGEDLVELYDHTGTALTIQGDEDDDNIVVYNNNGMLTIYSNQVDDRVYIEQTDAQVDIFTHAGTDDVYIKGNTATVNIDTGIDIDFVKIGAYAALSNRVVFVEEDGNLDLILATINVTGDSPFGTPGTRDLLDINDEANTVGRHLELRWDRVTILDNAGQPDINYTDIETLDMYMGTGSDKIDIRSTILSTLTRIFGNDGDETFNLGDDTDDGAANLNRLDQIAGELELYGQAHFDVINLNDSGAEAGSAANDGRITNSVIDGFGLGEFIRYFGFDLMNLTLGDEDESVELLGLFSSAMADGAKGLGGYENEKRTAFIQTGGGDDDVYVGHDDSTNTTLPVENNPATMALPADDYTNIGVNEIYGDIFFDMGAGSFDTLNILERNETSDSTNGRYLDDKSYQQITDTWDISDRTDRNADGHIIGLDDLLDTDPGPQELAVDNIEEINIFMGTGDDIISIEASDSTEESNLENPDHESIPGQDGTNIFAGDGNDRIVLFNEQYLLGSVDAEAGWDILDYSRWTHGTFADFRTGRAEGFNSGYNDGIFDFSEILGGSNDDFYFGDDLDNIFIGNAGNDVLYGFAGVDLLDGGSGDDKLFGGAGTDALIGDVGDDYLIGGDGSDLLDDGLGSDIINGGMGDDQYLMTSNLIGNRDRDLDTVIDEGGEDTLNFSEFEYRIELYLTKLYDEIYDYEGAYDGSDYYDNDVEDEYMNEDREKRFLIKGLIENVIGTPFSDIIEGNEVFNILVGGPGNDELKEKGNSETNKKDTIIQGSWAPDAILPVSGDHATIYELPTMPEVDTTDFRQLVMDTEPWTKAKTKSTSKSNRIYKYNVSSKAPDVMVFTDPTNSDYVIIAAFKKGAFFHARRVKNYVGIKINGTSSLSNAWKPGTRAIVIDDISSTGMSVEVILNGSNNILDASTITHEITVKGSSNDDIIATGSGNDTINAGSGDDQIDAGAGNDIVNAGSGNDIVFGRDGNDEIRGDNGDDIILGENGDDRLVGGLQDDLIVGGLGDDIIIGDGYVDFNIDANRDIIRDIYGVPSFTVSNIYLYDGDDDYEGDDCDDDDGDDDNEGECHISGGDDTLIGGNIGLSLSASGDDYIYGSQGNDLIIGDDAILYNDDTDNDGFWDVYVIDTQARTADPETDGDDILFGNQSNDWIFGQGGNDMLDAGSGNDFLDAGVGADSILTEDGANIVLAGYGDDEIFSYNLETRIFAGFGNDLITADPDSDEVDDGPGDDIFIPYVNNSVGTPVPYDSVFDAEPEVDPEERIGNRYFYDPDGADPQDPDYQDIFWPSENEIDQLLELQFLNEDEAEESHDDEDETKPEKSKGFFIRVFSMMFSGLF
ncbi:MAG: hypothetical protein HRT89_09835, partial [Lentisphaeria bacterium]|nr:hypothetical protein [Lentisphaeria bacterium]